MSRVGKIGISVLSLLLLATPIMACAMEANAMTAAERECCKRMAGECGKGKMSQSHSCCQTVAIPDHLPAIKSSSGVHSKSLALVLVHALPAIATMAMIPESGSSPREADIHSPPVSPPITISVLRI